MYHTTAPGNMKLIDFPTWRQTLDFSSRYCSTRAPSMAPPLVKLMSIYFPKRLELSLWMVLALPKAESKIYVLIKQGRIQATMKTGLWLYVVLIPSKMGFASRICCSIQECCPLTAARNCNISLVLSVFPAPDSPLSGEWRIIYYLDSLFNS